MKAQFRMTKGNELILVYVNSNKNGKKWYECYDVYDGTFFEASKEYLLECRPVKSSEYPELITVLKRKYLLDISEIINRLPKL